MGLLEVYVKQVNLEAQRYQDKRDDQFYSVLNTPPDKVITLSAMSVRV